LAKRSEVTHILNPRERRTLDKLSFDRSVLIKGQFSVGEGGHKTMESLVGLGLAKTAPSDRFPGDIGWRITPDGWRCMYGKTYEEIMAPGGSPVRPLKVWRWPL
jgi:hypothetical protein